MVPVVRRSSSYSGSWGVEGGAGVGDWERLEGVSVVVVVVVVSKVVVGSGVLDMVGWVVGLELVFGNGC